MTCPRVSIALLQDVADGPLRRSYLQRASFVFSNNQASAENNKRTAASVVAVLKIFCGSSAPATAARTAAAAAALLASFGRFAVEFDPLSTAVIIIGQKVGGADSLHFLARAGLC